MSDDPSIPTLRHVIEDDHFVFLVMVRFAFAFLDYRSTSVFPQDLCEGRTLNAFVKRWEAERYEPECFTAKKSVMKQLIQIVQRCHERSVFHRDIKCENVLVPAEKDLVSLVDFGIATGDELSADKRVGTPQYMSPGQSSLSYYELLLMCPSECYHDFQRSGDCIPFDSAKNDVWSLGGTFHPTMLTELSSALANLISCLPVLLAIVMIGKLIWRRPQLADPDFAEFIRYPHTFFRSKFAVTKEAQHLLSRALQYDPEKRIDLATFAAEFEKIDRFFVSTTQMLWTPMIPFVESMTHFRRLACALGGYERFWAQRALEARNTGKAISLANGRERISYEGVFGMYRCAFQQGSDSRSQPARVGSESVLRPLSYTEGPPSLVGDSSSAGASSNFSTALRTPRSSQARLPDIKLDDNIHDTQIIHLHRPQGQFHNDLVTLFPPVESKAARDPPSSPIQMYMPE